MLLLLLVLLTQGVNAAWYSASGFAGTGDWLFGPPFGTTRLNLLLASVGLAAAAFIVLAWHRRPLRPGRLRAALIGLAVLASVAVVPPIVDAARAVTAEAPDRPQVVILGIDSLRADLSKASKGPTLTPRIDAFLADSHRFTDTMSPLARTYDSWMSILTGRHFVTTNARFNLMPRALVREGETLAEALRASGYRTVYATDETRFANFDESFGFDQLITPPLGASDFLLGKIRRPAARQSGRGLARQRLAVSGQSRQSRRLHHLPSRGFHVAARAGDPSFRTGVLYDPPDARPLALFLGRSCHADDAADLPPHLLQPARGRHSPIPNSKTC